MEECKEKIIQIISGSGLTYAEIESVLENVVGEYRRKGENLLNATGIKEVLKVPYKPDPRTIDAGRRTRRAGQ